MDTLKTHKSPAEEFEHKIQPTKDLFAFYAKRIQGFLEEDKDFENLLLSRGEENHVYLKIELAKGKCSFKRKEHPESEFKEVSWILDILFFFDHDSSRVKDEKGVRISLQTYDKTFWKTRRDTLGRGPVCFYDLDKKSCGEILMILLRLYQKESAATLLFPKK